MNEFERTGVVVGGGAILLIPPGGGGSKPLPILPDRDFIDLYDSPSPFFYDISLYKIVFFSLFI